MLSETLKSLLDGRMPFDDSAFSEPRPEAEGHLARITRAYVCPYAFVMRREHKERELIEIERRKPAWHSQFSHLKTGIQSPLDLVWQIVKTSK